MKTVNERLREYLRLKGITQAEASSKLNISIQRLNNWLTDTSIPMYSLTDILNHYPDLNSEWLLTGEGEMLKDVSMVHHEPPEPYHINKVCAMCEEKDKMIEVLNQRIADKDDMIDLLKGKKGLADCG